MSKGKLEGKYIGKIVISVYTLLYSAATYYVMDAAKKQLQEQAPYFQPTIVIALIIAYTAIAGIIRDYVNDELNMQSSYNKEKKEHETSKEKISSLENELNNTKQMLEAMQVHFSNTLMSEAEPLEKIRKITSAMCTISKQWDIYGVRINKRVHEGNSVNIDYMNMFDD